MGEWMSGKTGALQYATSRSDLKIMQSTLCVSTKPPPSPFQRKEAMMRLKLFLSGLESQAMHPSMPYANLGYLDSRFRLQAIGCILNPMASSACFSSSGKRGEHFSHSSAGRVIAYPYSPFDRSSSFLLVLTGPCLRDLCRGRPVGQA
jgi:hypothetical protein